MENIAAFENPLFTEFSLPAPVFLDESLGEAISTQDEVDSRYG